MSDTITVEILPDGTIKTTTDPISPANHQSAEAMLNGFTVLAGGPATRKARHGHTHAHSHEHTHDHADVGHTHD
jgi:hypothetical protein